MRVSANAVNALRISGSGADCGSNIASKHARKHEARPHGVKKREEFRLDSDDFGFICAGVSKVDGYKNNNKNKNKTTTLK